MKKHSILLATALSCLMSVSSFAQETKKDTVSYWKKATSMGATFNQASFNDSWAATQGSKGSVGLNLFYNTKGEYNKDKVNWVNDLQLQYGLLDNGSGMRKTIDRIFFDSKIGHKISKTWLVYGNVNVQSQFTKGYNYGAGAKDVNGNATDLLVSNLFAPGYITESVGLEWKPNTVFNMTFAPGAVRQTIVADKTINYDANGLAYGVDVKNGKTLRNEVAILQIVANYNKDIAKNVNLKLRYQLFANYQDLAAMDSRLDAKFTAKINKYLSTTFDFIAIYDQDQIARLQTAQNLGVGLLYSF